MVAVQLLNVVRVISLFYIGQWNFDVFEWAHLYVWQALIMLDVLIVWLIWVRRVPPWRRDAGRRPPRRRSASAAAMTSSPGRSLLALRRWWCLRGCRSTFAVWYFAAPVILWPAQLLARRSRASASATS